MMNKLLKKYIDAELNERQLGRIEATVEEALLNPSIIFREFSGNRYFATIDFQKKIVIINDDLDVNESGETTISLQDFFSSLDAQLPNLKIDKIITKAST